MCSLLTDTSYKQALLIRRTEDAFLELFSQGKMNGTVHTCNGQEFSAVAFASALSDGDFIFSNHRCHGHYIAHTNDVESLIAELMGKESGTCGGIGSSQHLYNRNFFSNGIQGGIAPVAAGVALSNKLSNNNLIGIVFIGDGTLGQGVVYETFNLLSLLEIPLLCVCEDNGYAQSTPKSKALSGDILSRAKSFNLKTFSSDTWDVEKLFRDAKRSINYVRLKKKPAFHLVKTYRLNDHSKSDDKRDEAEIDAYRQKDVLNIYRETFTDKYNIFLREVDQTIKQAVARAESQSEMRPNKYYDPRNDSVDEKTIYIELESIDQKVVHRINQFFDDAMSKDKTLLFIGEDVLSPYGGAFKVAENLSDKYPNQVISTPISEQAITGLSNGLAISGYRPYLEIMFGDFITLSMDQIINHASKFHHMYNMQISCPLVIRTPMGGGRGYGPTHSQSLEKHLAGIDNVTVIALNRFVDPYFIYKNIHDTELHPVILIENKIDYGKTVGFKKIKNYSLEKSNSSYPVVRCSPKDTEPTLTIVTYGGISDDVIDSIIDIFRETELIPEVIILSIISPLDISAIIDSVSITGSLVVIEEGGKEFGVGSEIISRVVEELDCVEYAFRIGALPVPIPSSKMLEQFVLPNTSILQQIIDGVS